MHLKDTGLFHAEACLYFRGIFGVGQVSKRSAA